MNANTMPAPVAAPALNAPRARAIILAGATLGLAADLLMPNGPGRLGLALWVLLALSLVLLVMRDRFPAASAAKRSAAIVMGAMAAFAAAFVLRDAETLSALTFLALMGLAALLAWIAGRGRSLARVRLRDVPVAYISTGLSSAFGLPMLALRDAELTRSTSGSRTSVVGIVIAMPVVLVAGALLAGSDPVFGSIMEQVLDFALSEHLVIIGFYAWCSAGWLRGFRAPFGADAALEDKVQRPAEGLRLLLPVLQALALLLALFLGVQARALFGGAEYVEQASGLSYAEYARRGVFGLVVVAGIVLSALVVATWLADGDDASERRSFRRVGWVLVALVTVLIVSAFQRMGLYMSFYGLSTLRVYAMAATTVVAAAVALLSVTVMRGRGDRFAVGALGILAVALLSLHVLNPERLVVNVNAARAAGGAEFDVAYHVQLSADAVPTLLAAARSMPGEQCHAIVAGLQEAWSKRFERLGEGDWRQWQLPVARLRRWFEPAGTEALRSWCA